MVPAVQDIHTSSREYVTAIAGDLGGIWKCPVKGTVAEGKKDSGRAGQQGSRAAGQHQAGPPAKRRPLQATPIECFCARIACCMDATGQSCFETSGFHMLRNLSGTAKNTTQQTRRPDKLTPTGPGTANCFAHARMVVVSNAFAVPAVVAAAVALMPSAVQASRGVLARRPAEHSWYLRPCHHASRHSK